MIAPFARILAGAALVLLAATAVEGQTPEFKGMFGPSHEEFDPAGYQALHGKTGLWDSRQGKDSNRGTFQWGPFRLESDFALYVAGSIGEPGVSLYWEDAASGRRQLLASRSPPGPRWTLYRWTPPSWWVGRLVYLGAEDHSDSGWVGLSAPQHPTGSPLRWSGLVLTAFGLFAALLLPGWAWAACILRRRALSSDQFLALVLIASATLAYGVFWVYFLHRAWGLAAAWTILAVAVLALIGGRSPNLRTISADLAKPLALSLAVALMYLAGLLIYGGVEGASDVSLNRFIHGMPPDPLLPALLSEQVSNGTVGGAFFGDWLSSDRPPLQAAFNLLESPFGLGRVRYQVMATVLQTWVFLGLWILLRSAKIPARSIAWVLTFAVFTGFFFFNSVFVWPKLLPAAFLLMAAAFLWHRPGRSAAAVGACAGVAMLGHGGSAFGLLGLGIYFVFCRRSIGWRFALVACLVAAAYLLPWSLYQRYYDPPGNRLLKWHLAGVVPVDSRSFLRTLADSYGSLTFSQWVRGRAANFRALFTDDNSRIWTDLKAAALLARQGQISAAFRGAAGVLRIGGVLQMFQSPVVLDLGLFGLIFAWLRRREPSPALVLARRCLALTAICLVVWCLLMFIPGTTLNHQGTYLANACLFVALALGVLEFPRWTLWPLAAAHLAFFLAVWVFSSTRADYTPALLSSADPSMLSLFLLGFVLTLWSLFRLARETPGTAA